MGKLSDEQVRDVYLAIGDYKSVAARFGCSVAHVGAIKNSRARTNVTNELVWTDETHPGIAIGARHGSATLTDEQVREVFWASGLHTEIAKEFDCSGALVSRIKSKRARTGATKGLRTRTGYNRWSRRGTALMKKFGLT